MQTKHKLNHSLFIFGLTILLFVTSCLLVQAQTSQNDIVFQSARDSTPTVGNSEIYVMKADGSGQTNLTNSAEFEASPDWSPDGSRIVFSRSNNIWIMNADGSNKTQVTNGGTDSNPAWSPNGSKIAFEGNRSGSNADIYVMNADGSNQTRLTFDAASAGRSLGPGWSPDSSKIVFSSIRSATGSDFEIYTMNADGSNQTALTVNTFRDFSPDWSPLGSKIAFQSDRSGGDEIYTMNTDGSLQARITTQAGGNFSASWSPDATKFVFASSRDGSPQIYTMNADGSNQVRLTFTTGTAGPIDNAPRWSPRRTPTPSLLGNISTRLKVETGDNVLIGGFIVTGTEPKRVIVRAIGPSLPVPGKLGNPTLELYRGQTLLSVNDNWVDAPNKQEIIDSTIAPANDLESAILTTLDANSPGYTAIVRGVNGETGVAVVEVYDLGQTANSRLAQISTRGFVQTGDNIMIGGFFVLNGAQKVIVRAIGPSLPVDGKLADPTLELHDGNGALLEANDNWVDSPNKQAIIDTTVAPTNDFESAILRTLTPGPYTAIVRGKNDTTGIALVEVYALK